MTSASKRFDILDESVTDVVDNIANNLGDEFSVQEMTKIGQNVVATLYKNLFSSVFSLSNLTAKDWVAMDLPLRYYIDLRKQLEFVFIEYYEKDTFSILIPKKLQEKHLSQKDKLENIDNNKEYESTEIGVFTFEHEKENKKKDKNKVKPSKVERTSTILDQSEIFTPRIVSSSSRQILASLPSPLLSLPPPRGAKLSQTLDSPHPLSSSLPDVSNSEYSLSSLLESISSSSEELSLSSTPPQNNPISLNLTQIPENKLEKSSKSPRSLTRSTEISVPFANDNLRKVKKKVNPKSPFIRKKNSNVPSSSPQANPIFDDIPKNPKYTVMLQGTEEIKSQFFKILLESIGSSSHSSNAKQVSVASKTYDQLIEIQFLSLSPTKPEKKRLRRSSSFSDGNQLTFEPISVEKKVESSGNLFIFSATDPNSFSYIEYLLKSEPNLMNKPVYLLALNGNQRMKAKIHSNKYVSEAEAHELALKIKALHYFEITNAIQHLPLLVLALGRSCLRKQTFEQNFKHNKCLSIISNCDHFKRKISLKKKQLFFVPNQLLLLYNLKKINLMGNLLQYFPAELQFLVNLTELNLSDNFISIIEEKMIVNFTQLRRLNLENNQLDDFPIIEAYKMSFVEILLRGNPLSALSSKFKLTGKKSNIIITKIPIKKYPIFGEELKTLLESDRFYYPFIHSPLIIQKIFNWVVQYGLDKQGILRATGNQSKINKLKNSLFGAEISFRKEVLPLEISSLLKIFLRELPEPIFPSAHFQTLIDINNVNSKEEWVERMRTIFSLFKDINIKIIWSLIRLLRMIILNSHINLMPLQNVCKMIAPNIFRPPSSNQLSTSQQQVNAQISAISCSPIILETLILRSYELFDDYFDPFAYLDIVDPDLPILRNILYQKVHVKSGERLLSVCTFKSINNIWICLVVENKLICRILHSQSFEVVNEIVIQEPQENQEIGAVEMIDVGNNTVWISSPPHLSVRNISNGELISELKLDDNFKLFKGKKGVILLLSSKFIRSFDIKHNLSSFTDNELNSEEVLCSSFISSTCTLWQCLKKSLRIWDCSENKVDKDIPIAQTIIAIENAHDDEVWFLSSDHNIYVWDVYSVTFTRTIKIPLFVNSNLRSPSLPTVTNSSPNIPYFNAISDANATKTSSLQPNTSRAQRKQSCPNTSIPKSSSFGNSLSDGDEFDDSLEMDWENITNPNSFIQDQLAGIRRIGNHVWIYHSNDIITVLDSETHSILGKMNNFHRSEILDISVSQGNNKYFKVYSISANSLVMWLVANSPLDAKLKWKYVPALFDFSVEQNSLKSLEETINNDQSPKLL